MKPALLFILLLLTANAVAQSGNKNYILSRHYKQSGANANDISKVSVQVEYVDGLGRQQQRVNVGQSPTGADLVQPFSYNEFGRQVKQYLPYAAAGSGAFQTGADAGQAAFYTANTAGLDASDLGRPFIETGFELSPLIRPLSTRSPGNKSATANLAYGTNAANEVKRYDYVSNANLLSTVAANGSYAAGALERTQKTDENGKVETEYRDKQERLVCRKVIASAGESLFIYYVYDDYGQLRAVLQPMFQDNASLADYAFLYEYDQRGRIVSKKTPGAGMD
ncbi:DUF6443 domain-containing protein [Dyadobacter aurulentus]|uniref:DUF6443 domain-containing protein n=1 Tax=Dyadobacter sp. UC 10 TaxID=2605428 RepID=UPI0011F16281|nr:DUF6443 domain-containing protein [Dyadobacter sp. UC 10]KAA0989164.1 hypothetical protein FXO21_02780 [Dyadobacter sp. UC 10]